MPPTHGNLLQSLSITWIWNNGSAAAVTIDAVIAVALNVNIAVAVESVTSVKKQNKSCNVYNFNNNTKLQ